MPRPDPAARYLSITAVAKRVRPAGGKAPHTKTIFRWIRKGVNGVRLHAVKAGRTWLVPESSLEAFTAALAAKAAGETPVPAGGPAAEAGPRSHDLAAAELDSLGL